MTARPRLDSLDLLRGIVMVLMAIDHCRDYLSPQFTPGGFAMPENIPGVGLDWFLTRWVTHFCAPVFVLLAGTGVYLFQSRGRSRGETARFLLSRGVWLIVLELTIVHFGWFPTDPYRMIAFQVIWGIGASMAVMAALIWLPVWAIGAIGGVIILGHDALAFTPIEASIAAHPFQTNGIERVWMFVHSCGVFPIVTDGDGGWDRFAFVNYPVLPWLGVMAVGYALGPVMKLDARERVRWLLGLGAVITMGFFVLRFAEIYGDPHSWMTMTGRAGEAPAEGSRSAVDTVIAFLNCEKYPASLLFLMMTLGPALVALGVFDVVLARRDEPGAVAGFVITFGRVPLFFYVLHLYAIQVVTAVWALSRFGVEATTWGMLNPPPPAYAAYGLWPTYAAWVVIVVALYPACRWFAGVKRRSGAWWLSYL